MPDIHISQSVRLAFLIMAHDKPEQLLRLVNSLDHAEFRFYIHIDGKVSLEPFLALLSGRENVHLISNPVIANWMGYSLVEATLKLLSQAVRDGFEYCTLLSGADYPIRSTTELCNFFRNADKEYITFWRLDDRPSWMHKVEYFYPIDRIPIRNYIENRESVYWRRLFWGRFFRYRRYMPKRTFLKGLVPYGGPDWWSLSYGCATFILDYIKDTPNYSRFYRSTSSPGEMYFQTILLNSIWAERVENRANYINWSEARASEGVKHDTDMIPEKDFNLRYVDWSGEKTGMRETPAVLDERDWESIHNSRSLFARKFDPHRSAGLLSRIDREILLLPT